MLGLSTKEQSLYQTARYELEVIHSYMEALAREKQIKPIRGKPDIKPLGIRSKTYARIYKNNAEEVVCHLYNTDVVTFRPNGDIAVRLNGWATDSSLAFISEVLGEPFCMFDKQAWCNAVVQDGGESLHFPLHTYGETLFRRDSKGSLLILNPTTCKTHLVNRRGKTAAFKRYEDFRNYLSNICKLRMNEFGRVNVSADELHEMFKDYKYKPSLALRVADNIKVNTVMMERFRKLITKQGQEDKTRDFYEAFLLLALGRGAYQFMNDTVKPAEIISTFEDAVLYIHRDEAFNEVDNFGKLARDRYARFFG